MGCFTSFLGLMFLPFIWILYIWWAIILIFWELFKFIIVTLFGIVTNNSSYTYNKPHYNTKKSNIKKYKKTSYKDLEFDREANLWGLSENDRKMAKEERMSPADFIEAKERDDDELITDEWEVK